ncbi:hypothetical protein ACFFUT_14520 [Pseudohalocynthiibacter aestuariivivens]|jgi:hypothetical protein|uniref:EpsG family protein n=1 Tax=Pseudohalocynthiibacter aestuariivivens TaxID=1591409 RepID=A0ABV5JHR6_9RHOB|nr:MULTISPECIES: hypothetical protein [Pseudohalocynthiibacter]MBS9715498.1 hypothetical protein [Pseudohalocynthiibacter aestuariivivens]MCK0104553.1 hypothetical protein [Pseudohalocynthiibacter sp. F2068]
MMLNKRGYSVVLIVYAIIAVSVIKPPNDWAKTHFLLSYDLGIFRRGFLGQLLRPFYDTEMSQSAVFMIGALLTFVAGLVLVLFMTKCLRTAENGIEMALVFATSFGLATFLGNTGYFDGALAVLGVTALLFPTRGVIPLFAKTMICLTGVLVHEIMLPTYTLLVAFQIFFARDAEPFPKRILLSVSPIIASLLAVIVLFQLSPNASEMYVVTLAEVTSRAMDFNVRKGAVEAVMKYAEGEEPGYNYVWNSNRYLFELKYVSWIGVGFILYLIGAGWKLICDRPFIDRLAVLAAALGPLSLLFVAFDLSRLVSLAIIQSFVVLALILQHDDAARSRLANVFSHQVIVLLLVANVLISFLPLNFTPVNRIGFPAALLDLPIWRGEF